MIIKSIYISSFGKIKDFSLTFNDKTNAILESNGWGKSTIACFIKAMFYGLNDSKRSIEENERLKFKPWNSTESFGGNLVFIWKDKEYRIERFFGLKSADDIVKLYDNQTGKEFSKTEMLGERIFQIDEEGFLSTTYFSQKDLEVKTNSTITSKYGAVLDAEDAQKFDKTLFKIENQAKEYKSRGDKGLIYQTKKDILELEDKIESAKRAKEVLSTLDIQLKNHESELEELKKNQAEINDKLIRQAKSKSFAFKKQQIEKNEQKLSEINQKVKNCEFILNKNEINLEEHQIYLDCVKDYEKAQAIKNVLNEDVKKLSSSQNQSSTKLSITFMLLSIIFLLVSIGSFFVNVFLGLILLAPTIVFGLLWLLGDGRRSDKQLLTEKLGELKKFSELSFAMEEKINSYLCKFNLQNDFSYQEKLTHISNAYFLNNSLKDEERELLIEIKELKTDLEIEKGENILESESELSQKLFSINKAYKEKIDIIAETKTKINNYTFVLDSLSELENQKEITSEKLNDYVTHYNVLTKTVEFMKQANENMKSRYREPLKNAFDKFVKRVLKDKNVDIDIDFNVTIEENGQKKVTAFYSEGLKNIFNICKRFALIEVLFDKEKPFIILDDPFVNLDEENLKSIKEVLEILAEDYQILYFTCHNSRGV